MPIPQQYLAGMSFTVTDDATAADNVAQASATPSSGGGFVMSREEMEDLLDRCRRVRNRVDTMRQDSRQLDNVSAPAQDPASLSYNPAVNESGRYYLGHLDLWKARLDDLVDKLEDALGITTAKDEQVAEDIGKAKGALE